LLQSNPDFDIHTSRQHHIRSVGYSVYLSWRWTWA